MRGACSLLLLLLLPLSFHSQVNDANDDSYEVWLRLSEDQRMVFAAAALSGAAYWCTRYVTVNAGRSMPDPFKDLPLGETNTEAVSRVDRIYALYSRFRNVPYVVIILEPGYWKRYLQGGKDGSTEEKPGI